MLFSRGQGGQPAHLALTFQRELNWAEGAARGGAWRQHGAPRAPPRGGGGPGTAAHALPVPPLPGPLSEAQ